MLAYPRVVVDLKKFRHNVINIQKICAKQRVEVFPVLKGAGGDRKLLEVLADLDIKFICDSRIQNLQKSQDLPMAKVLLRLPMLSAVEDVIRYTDISLNSEISVIKALNDEAKKQNKVHRIILMIELGDLREGILPKDVDSVVEQILSLNHIKFYGIGVNLTCYGAIIPDEKNLGELCDIAARIEEKFSITLEIISGGNSSSIPMILTETFSSRINMLRLGESILRGTETVEGSLIPDQYSDVFILEAELIECQYKNTVPTGRTGVDAFGNPYVEIPNRGIRKRGIAAIGRQDIEPSGLTPMDPNISIIGASSDHCIIDLDDADDSYKVGDIIRFNMEYSSLLRAMTSSYVYKIYIE